MARRTHSEHSQLKGRCFNMKTKLIPTPELSRGVDKLLWIVEARSQA